MGRLIDDVLDFARGRLGGGIAIKAHPIADLSSLIEEVIAQLLHVHKGRSVKFTTFGRVPAVADEVRTRQLFSNLLGNALEHSPKGEPVIVDLDEASGLVRLSIHNRGDPLPPELVGNLFEPFHRPLSRGPRAGLGLGLFIASEIARAHEGTIQAESNGAGTTFTLLLPPQLTG